MLKDRTMSEITYNRLTALQETQVCIAHLLTAIDQYVTKYEMYVQYFCRANKLGLHKTNKSTKTKYTIAE